MTLSEKLSAIQTSYTRQLPSRRTTSILAASASAEPTIYVYDAINPEGHGGISAKALVAALAQTRGARTLHIRINSPGGSVFEMKAMLQALREHKARRVVHIDGLAASAASVLAMVGDDIVASPEAIFFIHGAQGLAYGSAAELRQTADLLDSETANIRAIYQRRTRQKPEDLQSWMNAETFFDAKTAKSRGFCDRIDGEGGPTARLPIELRIRLARAGIRRAH